MNKFVTSKQGKDRGGSLVVITVGFVLVGILWIVLSKVVDLQGSSTLIFFRLLQVGTLNGLFIIGGVGVFLFLLADRFRSQQTAFMNKELIYLNEQLARANEKISTQASIIVKQKDDQLNRILETLNDVVWSYDLTGKGENYLSRNVEVQYDESKATLLKRPFFWLENIHPDDLAIQFVSQKALDETGYAESTYRITDKQGAIRWIFNRERIIRNDQGVAVKLEGISTDITYLKKTEAIIAEQELMLRAVLGNLDISVVIMDITGKIIFLNRIASNFNHFCDVPLTVGANFMELAPAEQKAAIHDTLAQVMNTKSTVRYVARCQRNNAIRFFSVHYNPVLDNAGNVIQMCVLSREITEQKLADEKLKQERNLLRTLIDNIPDYVYVKDHTLNHIINNNALVKLIGAPSEEATLGKSVKDYFSREVAKGIIEDDLKVLTSGRSLINHEEELIDNKGGKHWLLTTKVPLKDDEGNVTGLVGISRDITSRKEMELMLLENQYILQKAQQVAHIGHWMLFITNDNYEITCSPEILNICGLAKADFDGKVASFFKLIHPQDLKRVICALQGTLKKNKPYDIDFRIVRPEGTIRWVHQQADVSRDGERKPVSMIGVMRDITERKNSALKIQEYAQSLRISNERYRLASIATDDAIWDWDLKTNDLFWGEGFKTLFGYDVDHGKNNINSWKDHIHPEDIDHVIQGIWQVINSPSGKKWEAEYRYQRADGSYAIVFDRGFVIRDEGSNPLRMIGAMQDVTERTKSIEEIRKLSLVASKTDNVVVILNKSFKAEWVNEAFTRLTGYTSDEAIDNDIVKLLQGPETDLYTVDRINTRLANGKSVAEEILHYGKQGKKFWLRININPIFNAYGVIEKYISIQSDITEQKEYEHSIMTIARERASIIEHANVPIFGFDRQGYIDEWNEICSKITGFKKNEVYGQKALDLAIIEQYRGSVSEIHERVFAGESISNYEFPIVTRDQEHVIILLNITPRWNSKGKIVGALAIGQDVTELTAYRKSLEQKVQERTRELYEALNKEKELVEMKGRFVSIASHEFRTPLASIQFAAGFIKKFKDRIGKEDIVNKVNNIEKQVLHMTHLLDDVLVFGKCDSGKIKVSKSVINLHDFFEKIIQDVELSTGNTHKVEFVEGNQPIIIDSDEKLLRNIFINLLSNAIKFSPGAGSVLADVKAKDGKISIRIQDHGIGIEPGEQDKIFEPFHRASNATAIQGTGLGLSIAKKAVELLEGNMEVSSALEKGTTFSVTLPL